jgi:hypothetical protein
VVLNDPALAGVDIRAEQAFALLQQGDLRYASYANLEETQRLWEQSLTLYVEVERPWEQSYVLARLADIARFFGDVEAARRHLRACRAIREAAGDRRGLAEALNYEAQIAAEGGAMSEALDLARRSHAIYEELGDPSGRAFGLARLGLTQMWAGLYHEAQRSLAASRALYEDLGDQLEVAYNTNRLAYVIMGVGDLEEAWALATRSIDSFRAVLGSDEPQAIWTGGLIALMRGDLGTAVCLLQESAELSEQIGSFRHAGLARSWLALTRWLRGGGAEAQAELLAVLRSATPIHDILALHGALLGIVLIFADERAPERALELYALTRQHPAIGNNQAFTTFFGSRLDAACTALPPESAQTAQARGQAQDLWATAQELLAELEATGWGEVTGA